MINRKVQNFNVGKSHWKGRTKDSKEKLKHEDRRQSWQDDFVGKALRTKSESQSLIPKTQTAEDESQFLQAGLWPLHGTHTNTDTHTHDKINKRQK